MTTLTCNNLTTGYTRPHAVLRGINARFESGVTAIIGPNGAGKSTLLRTLLATQPLWTGSVLLDDKPLHDIPPRKRARRIAYIAQRPIVSTDFTVREVVALGRYAAPASKQAVDHAIERADLTEHAHRPFHTLSIGQQQRVAVARALAQLQGAQPRSVLLADEPVSAMDPAHAHLTFTILRELALAGVIVLIVLHDLTHAIRIADDALILDANGALAAHGPAEQTLDPRTLQRIFAVTFDMATLPHGKALIPAGAGNISP